VAIAVVRFSSFGVPSSSSALSSSPVSVHMHLPLSFRNFSAFSLYICSYILRKKKKKICFHCRNSQQAEVPVAGFNTQRRGPRLKTFVNIYTALATNSWSCVLLIQFETSSPQKLLEFQQTLFFGLESHYLIKNHPLSCGLQLFVARAK
jgi:hypothetical protein